MPTKILANEFRLLVACSWAPPEPLRGAQGRLVEQLSGSDVDWAVFLGLLRRHQVQALAWSALERWGGSAIPAPVSGELRVMAMQARTKALRVAAECARIARSMSGEGIALLPLKGVPLSVELFGDPAARQAGDVDVMVRTGDLERAEAVLESLGYISEFPRARLTPRMRRMLHSCAHESAYRHPGSGIAVDLHWDQELWTRPQVEELWLRTEETTCLGVPMRRLDGDGLLLYLCDHGAKHKWSRLKWLSDVAMLLARPREQPWEELFAAAKRLDAAVSLAEASLLTQWLYGLKLPEELVTFVRRDSRAPVLAEKSIVAMRLTHEELQTATRREGIVRKFRSQLARRPALPIADYLRRTLIQAEDLARFALPDSLLWLYYPLRPVFWLWRQCWLSDRLLDPYAALRPADKGPNG